MGLVLAIYIILLLAFLVGCAMIFRHTIKFGYLSPTFKTVVSVFAVLALAGVIFSLYLVIGLFSKPSGSSYTYPTPTVITPSDINF